ncbi:MAG: hypothetical protein RRB13_11545 [bacterium]|nr:hypothetical protein [bacterium]
MRFVSLILLTALLLPQWAFAETSQSGFVFFPVLDSSFDPNFTIAAVNASVTADPYGHPTDPASDQMPGSGAELQLDCPWFQFGANPLRQQISVVDYEYRGLKMRSLELNPHYVMTAGFVGLGFGPGFGFLEQTDAYDQPHTYFTLQYGASLVFNLGFLHLAIESRRQMSQEENGKHLDNLRQVTKVGINF